MFLANKLLGIRMSFFNQFNKMSIIQRQQETKLYEFVMDEIKDGVRHQGSWGKALVKCEGDEQKASAEYIKLRVQELKDFITLENIIEDERLKAIQQMDKDNKKIFKTKTKENKIDDNKIVKNKNTTLDKEKEDRIKSQAQANIARRMSELDKK